MNIIRLQGQNASQQGVYYEFDKDSTPIGEGGMGVLYLGARVHYATGIRMPVVIKCIRDEISSQAHLIARAMREASVQIDNENLIRMYDFVTNYENAPYSGASIIRYYIVMEYLSGLSLDNILSGNITRNGEIIPLAQELDALQQINKVRLTVYLMRNLLSGILALHNCGYIHRDLDPSNIMVTREGKIKIIDFGICKNLRDPGMQQLSAPGAFMGKVHYAPPELILGAIQDQNYTTDIYALGIILYQLYCGELPSRGLTDQEAMEQHLKGNLPYKNIDNRDLRRIFRKATEAKQRKRYQTAAEFLVDIERVKIPADKASFQSAYHSHPQPQYQPEPPAQPQPQYQPQPQPQPQPEPQPQPQPEPQYQPEPPAQPHISNPGPAPIGTMPDVGFGTGGHPETPLTPPPFSTNNPVAPRQDWDIPSWVYVAAGGAGVIVGSILSIM